MRRALDWGIGPGLEIGLRQLLEQVKEGPIRKLGWKQSLNKEEKAKVLDIREGFQMLES